MPASTCVISGSSSASGRGTGASSPGFERFCCLLLLAPVAFVLHSFAFFCRHLGPVFVTSASADLTCSALARFSFDLARAAFFAAAVFTLASCFACRSLCSFELGSLSWSYLVDQKRIGRSCVRSQLQLSIALRRASFARWCSWRWSAFTKTSLKFRRVHNGLHVASMRLRGHRF